MRKFIVKCSTNYWMQTISFILFFKKWLETCSLMSACLHSWSVCPYLPWFAVLWGQCWYWEQTGVNVYKNVSRNGRRQFDMFIPFTWSSWQSSYDLQYCSQVCHWQQSGRKQKTPKVTLKIFYAPASVKKFLPLESLFPFLFTLAYTWKWFTLQVENSKIPNIREWSVKLYTQKILCNH